MASSFSIQYANLFGIYKHPQISFVSQDPLQSDKQQFPFFYRTVPSENTLYSAVIALLKHFGWTWVGIIVPDDGSSIHVIKVIKEMIMEYGGCIEFIKTVPSINDYSPERILEIRNLIVKSTAKVILVYGSKNNVYYLEQNIHTNNIPGKVFISTAENSFRMFNIINDTTVNGTLQFVMHKKEIPDFTQFIHEVDPTRFPPGRTFTTWWDELCANRCPFNPRRRNCTGVENGRQIVYSHCNLRFTAMSYSVYNSVYILAQALHKMYQETQVEKLLNKEKLNFQDLKPWKLHRYLKIVNFTNTVGQQIYFNEDGISNGYDIYNIAYMPNGTIRSEKVGSFNYDAPPGKQFTIDEKRIIWEKTFTETPRSVCSNSCQPGYRKSVQEGQPVCCFDCLPCPEGEFSNQTDVDVCAKCPEDQWPNEQKTACIPKTITFLSYQDPIGRVLTLTAMFFVCLSVAILVTLIKYQDTPIVKANNRNLSYLLLTSLIHSFFCCLLFIGNPDQVTCFLRQTIFGISFSISVSSLLAKTLIVVIAFNATKPGNNLRKWIGPKVPKSIVFSCSLIQVIICLLWLLIDPPYPYYNMNSETGKIIVECKEGPDIAFYFILGYLCILASISFIVAFLARKLPDTFNDAKFITFSMLVFCSVWIFFIPTHLSTKGTSMVAVEVFAILASSSGLLGCIFAPKCYIILLKPEKNLKNNMLR
ncbi:vomeronasal type-2 receptor 26-like [Discoglossus pictus]